MCGIFLRIALKDDLYPPDAALQRRHKCRGPDASRTENISLEIEGQDVEVLLSGSVLSLRGDDVTVQPTTDRPNAVNAEGLNTFLYLCWNGEAWKIDQQRVEGNDTIKISQLLQQAIRDGDQEKSYEKRVIDALKRVEGPYAFVCYDTINRNILFARDCLGRRSLLSQWSETDFSLSSVGDNENRGWKEVEANTLHIMHLGRKEEPGCPSTGEENSKCTFTAAEECRFRWGCLTTIPFSSSSDMFTLCRNPTPPSHKPLHTTSQAVQDLESHLRRSLSLRLTTLKPNNSTLTPPRIAILFSGGLDCTVLAALSHTILPPDEPIDLLNVAFENPRITQANPNADPYDICPDRITASSSLHELQRVYPTRPWRLIKINIPYALTLQHKPEILRLMHPHETEMDLSIALALYFAARGIGTLNGGAYETQARVLLSGLGADELFGGYQRHATAFARGGHEALISELQLDLSRLGTRNLGRDDRVIAHWAKEARHPYLDEGLVAWAAARNVSEKCGFGMSRVEVEGEEGMEEVGLEPGKLVLRLVAVRLGLEGVAREKKRAIQFGARTARMEQTGGRKKGTDLVE